MVEMGVEYLLISLLVNFRLVCAGFLLNQIIQLADFLAFLIGKRMDNESRYRLFNLSGTQVEISNLLERQKFIS